MGDIQRSLESIEMQPSGKYEDMDSLFTEMRSDVVLDNTSNKTLMRRYSRRLVKLIRSYFGMATTVRFNNVRNAWIMPLYANKRHVLSHRNLREVMDTREFKNKTFDDTINDLRSIKGTINLNTAKVGGAFTTYMHEVTIDIYYFFKSLRLSVRSVVSILFHELGHGFHMMEYSDRTHDVNTTLMEITRAIRDKKAPREYEYLVKDLSKQGLQDEDIEDIIGSPTRTIFTHKLSKAVFSKMLSYETNDKYSDVSNERLADNFATRCGYGEDLSKALTMWDRDIIYENHSTIHVMIQASWGLAIVFMFMFMALGLPGLAFITYLVMSIMYVLIGFNSKNTDFTYDNGIHRYRSIRDDLLMQLKQNKHLMSKASMLMLIDQYDAIDKIIESKAVSNTIKNTVANVFSSGGRLARNDIARQRRLENLANNPMFIESMRIALA